MLRHEGSRRIENIKLNLERERTEARTLQLEREKERMERELELKTKHLRTLAMTIEQHSNFIGTIGSALRDVSRDVPQRKRKRIDELRKQLEQNQNATEEWRLFKQQLENLDQDFIAMLAGKFPMLTPQEMKLCALLKVGLGSKEIAKVLSVTLRSVETYRLHIRRKIKLPASINLTTFIAGLR